MTRTALQELQVARHRLAGRLPDLEIRGMGRLDAWAAEDIWVDMSLDEAAVVIRIVDVLKGRRPEERPVGLVAAVDSRLADLAARYPANDSLQELIARRQALHGAVELLVAVAGMTIEELVQPVITERWFCLAGDPPDVEAILGALRSRGIEARLQQEFPVVHQDTPWYQMVIDAGEHRWIWLEVFRPGARWRTRRHGTFRQEIRDAMATLPAGAQPAIRRQLRAARFMIGAYPPGGAAGRDAIAALREYLVHHHEAMVWADGSFVATL